MNVYGYTRVSTVRQSEEGLSIEAQEQRIRGYAKGILGVEPAAIFQERGVSASIAFSKRPQGQELLTIVKSGDVIVALRLDRIFRSALDCLRMIEELRQKNVRLHLVDMGDVTQNGFAKVFMTIAASFAELERERIRERTLEVHAYRRSLGKHVAGRTPFGYEKRDGYLIEHPAQQKALKRMRQLRAQGKSFRAIASQIKDHFGFSVSPFGIQRIVENKRNVAEDVIHEKSAAATKLQQTRDKKRYKTIVVEE